MSVGKYVCYGNNCYRYAGVGVHQNTHLQDEFKIIAVHDFGVI